MPLRRLPSVGKLLGSAAVLAVLGLFVHPSARAEGDSHPAAPARPLFSSPASGLATGSMQLEVGYAFSKSDRDLTRHLSPMALRFQALDWLEPRLFWDGVGEVRQTGASAQTGVGDVGLGAAFYFRRDSRWLPALGALVTVVLPVGSDGLSSETTRVDARALIQKSAGGFFSFGLNAGLAGLFPSGGGDSDLRLPLAATATGHLFGLVDVSGEIFGEFDLRAPKADPAFSARAGIRVRIIDELVLDTAVDFGVTGLVPNLGLQVGITWNFAKLF